MARAALIDPATGERVVFEMNPSSQEDGKRERSVAVLKPAAAGWRPVSSTLQQSERGPLTKRYSGLAPSRAQHAMLLRFRALSEEQSVIFEDPDGTTREVLVTAYEPTRRRVVRGPRGGLEVWNYQLELQVLDTNI